MWICSTFQGELDFSAPGVPGVFRVVVIEGRSLPRKSEKNSVVNFYHQTNYRSNKNRDICRKFSVRLFTRSFVGPIEKIGLLKAAAVDSLRALAGPLFPHWQRYGRRALWQVLLSSPLTWLLRHSAPPLKGYSKDPNDRPPP